MRDVEEAPKTRPRRPGWLASPVLSVVVALAWILMQGSLSVATLLWAAILGLMLPWLVDDFVGRYPRLRRPAAAVRLLFVVLWDIVRSNLTVARIVLEPGRVPRPAWLRVPYGLRDPRGIALLATIITNTPGTVSALVDETRHEILVHALDAADPEAVVREIQARYERPLSEIFE